MTRRPFVALLSALGFGSAARTASAQAPAPAVAKFVLPDGEWKKRLTPAQYDVLRHEGTERPGTSPLNGEKRKGTYHCVGCEHPLFSSDTKFESGTGWPSFFAPLAGAFTTKTDYKILVPRVEYRCAKCDGHHGHVFDDGPRPTGKRYCNNGVVLKFVPATA